MTTQACQGERNKNGTLFLEHMEHGDANTVPCNVKGQVASKMRTLQEHHCVNFLVYLRVDLATERISRGRAVMLEDHQINIDVFDKLVATEDGLTNCQFEFLNG